MRSSVMLNTLRRIYHLLPKPPSTNYYLGAVQCDPYELLPKGALVLDLGAKQARGVYAFTKSTTGVRVFCLDIQRSPGVDVVGDGHHIPLQTGSVDCVLCVGVLLHVREPDKVIAEIARVLKPGGIVYINAPFVFRQALDPVDYWRFSVDGLEILCRGFEKIQTGFNRGPASIMADLLVHFLAIAVSCDNKQIYGLALDVFQWLFFWIKYLDRLIGHYQLAKVIHSGAFFLGRKVASATR